MDIKTVETFRRIRDRYFEETKELSFEARRELFRQRAAEAREKARNLKKRRTP